MAPLLPSGLYAAGSHALFGHQVDKSITAYSPCESTVTTKMMKTVTAHTPSERKIEMYSKVRA